MIIEVLRRLSSRRSSNHVKLSGRGRAEIKGSVSGAGTLIVGQSWKGLLAEPTQFLGLGGGRSVVAFSVVGLGLVDPVTQRLLVHTPLLGQSPDHRLGVGLR